MMIMRQLISVLVTFGGASSSLSSATSLSSAVHVLSQYQLAIGSEYPYYKIIIIMIKQSKMKKIIIKFTKLIFKI